MGPGLGQARGMERVLRLSAAHGHQEAMTLPNLAEDAVQRRSCVFDSRKPPAFPVVGEANASLFATLGNLGELLDAPTQIVGSLQQ